jgi:hypothetical protein
MAKREKDFETVIAKYPELIEAGLRLVGRQSFLRGRRKDLLFEDHQKNYLVAAVRWGPIKDTHIGQVIPYAGRLVSGRPVREMLVGTMVPPNLQAILDYRRIGWRQITAAELRDFLRAKGDEELAKVFDADALTQNSSQSPGNAPAALLAPVEGRWLDAARGYFAGGKDVLYFFTYASIAHATELGVRHVYFKKASETGVTWRAELARITTDPQPLNTLAGHAQNGGRFYYGFRELQRIKPVQLSELRYYSTDRALRQDAPGPRVINEPNAIEVK